MPTLVTMPNGDTVTFPDGVSEEQMLSALKEFQAQQDKQIQPPTTTASSASKPLPSVIEQPTAPSKAPSLFSRIANAIGEATGAAGEEAAIAQQNPVAQGTAEAIRESVTPGNIAIGAVLTGLSKIVPPVGVASMAVLGAKALGQSAGAASVAIEQGDVRESSKQLANVLGSSAMIAGARLARHIRPAAASLIVKAKDIAPELTQAASEAAKSAIEEGKSNASEIKSPVGVVGRSSTGPAQEVAKGSAPQEKPPAVPQEKKIAPATFLGWQETADGGKIDLYNLTEDMGDTPKGSTVAGETLRQAGFELPKPPEELSVPPPAPELIKEPEEILAAALESPNPVATIIGHDDLVKLQESKSGLVSVGEELDRAITEANAPGEGGIARAPAKPPESPVTVKPSTALKTVLRAAEKAGAAGVKRGFKEGVASVMDKVRDLTEKISQSVSKNEALRMYFAGQEKGSTIGAQAMAEQLEMTQRWWDAQRREIASSLAQVLRQSLPVASKGVRSRFAAKITNLVAKPQKLVGGDPDAWYAQASALGSEILDAGNEYRRGLLAKEVQQTLDKLSDSPAIDAVYRKMIGEIAGQFGKPLSDIRRHRLESTREFIASERAAGREVDMPEHVLDELERLDAMPLADLPAADLAALLDKVNALGELGKLKLKTRRAVETQAVERALAELSNETTHPLDAEPELASPMQDVPMARRLENWWARVGNQASKTFNAMMPIDALMDIMDGGRADFTGWLHRHFRGVIDLNEQAKYADQDQLLSQYRALKASSGLTKAQWEKVAVSAYARQPNVRAHLIESGISEADLSVRLEPKEQAIYQEMRRVLDALGPRVQRTKYLLDNHIFEMVKDYFPVQRDWSRAAVEPTPAELLDGAHTPQMELGELAERLAADYKPRPRATTKSGFTEGRVHGQMAIRLRADEIFESHVADALHYVYQQPSLVRMARMLSDETFQAKYGKIGQLLIADWLNAVAREGRVDPSKRIAWMDWMRKRANVGIVGLRLASQIKHTTNLPFIMAHIGPKWFMKGLHAAFTREGLAFLQANANEVFRRGGGEIGSAEMTGALGKSLFFIARSIDLIFSAATVLGAYAREMSARGMTADPFDPATAVNSEAVRLALVRTRRAVASPLPKDLPVTLSRGTGVGGNVSASRLFLQFQNFALDRFSNVRLELFKRGLSDLKTGDPKQLAVFSAALVSAALIDAGITYGWRETKHSLARQHPKKEKTFEDDAVEGMLRQFIGMGPMMSAMKYGEYAPALSVAGSTLQSGYQAATGQGRGGRELSQAQRQAQLIRFGGGVAAIFGVPVSEMSDYVANKVAHANSPVAGVPRRFSGTAPARRNKP